MCTKIYYFSGTGNSLFLATKLNELLTDSELIPIVKALKNKDKKVNSDKVVIVFPVYALTLPFPVRDFLREYDFSNVKYFSVVASRLGLYFDDFKRIDKLLKPQKLNSHFLINMGHNDVKVKNYRCPSQEELLELEKIALRELTVASDIIENQNDFRVKDTKYLEALPYGDIRDKLLEWMVPKMMTFSKLIGGVNYYRINSNCNGCGICEKVCLSRKIEMKEKKPTWNKQTLCYMCYACVNYCPVKAIEIDSIPGVPSYTYENERYSHPYASYDEIENQKG